jgi:hypothetical protein
MRWRDGMMDGETHVSIHMTHVVTLQVIFAGDCVCIE